MSPCWHASDENLNSSILKWIERYTRKSLTQLKDSVLIFEVRGGVLKYKVT
jgi:hypothetical protein